VSDIVDLREQEDTSVALFGSERDELLSCGFRVSTTSGIVCAEPGGVAGSPVEGETGIQYTVHPGAQIGHFRLRSNRIVYIKPKVEIRNVFTMLGFAYKLYRGRSPFREEEVPYDEEIADALEPLVEHLGNGIEALLRDGLLKKYIEVEENLAVLRGKLLFPRQISQNLVRRDRLYCSFAQSETDIEENQVVLWTLLLLQRFGRWSKQTRQLLQSLVLRFGSVSIRQILPGRFPQFHYDRLSSRYEETHDWCRMFVDLMSLTDRPGKRSFHGYLLNMNELFERFVRAMFEKTSKKFTGLTALKEEPHDLDIEGRVHIHPDVIVRTRSAQIAIDAKYKVTKSQAKHPDLYQVVAYCAALGLMGQGLTVPEGILVYPASERQNALELDKELRIITAKGRKSELRISAIWLDLDSADLLKATENRFLGVLTPTHEQ
jgi:5-methylcytosine-specific restriction enzyme subunit McrC